eukprot:scaffold3743_cov120-Isochrysis_galbana.AAC.2
MRWDTLLSPGRLALPPFSPPPFTVSPGARPIISGMHGCGGGWLGLVLYIGPGWGYGGGPRHGVGRCGLPFYQREGRSALVRVRVGPLYPAPGRAPTVTPPTRIGFWEIGSSLGCAGGEESSLGLRDFFQMLPMVPGWAGGS